MEWVGQVHRYVFLWALSGCLAPVGGAADGDKLFGTAEVAPAKPEVIQALLDSPVDSLQVKGSPVFHTGDRFTMSEVFFDSAGAPTAEYGFSTAEVDAWPQILSAYDIEGNPLDEACDLRFDGGFVLRGFHRSTKRALAQYIHDTSSSDWYNYDRPDQCVAGTLVVLDWEMTYERLLAGSVKKHESDESSLPVYFPRMEAGRVQVILAQTDGYTGMLQSLVGLGAGRECKITPRDRLLAIATFVHSDGTKTHLTHLDWGSSDAHEQRSRQSGDCYAHNYYWVPGTSIEPISRDVLIRRLGGTTPMHSQLRVGQVVSGEDNREHVGIDPTTGAAQKCGLREGGALSFISFSEDGQRVVGSYKQSPDSSGFSLSWNSYAECEEGTLFGMTYQPERSLWRSIDGVFFVQ